MNNSISITIPLNKSALTRAAEMLNNIANDLTTETISVDEHNIILQQESDVADNSHIESKIPVSQGGTMLDEPNTETTAAVAFAADDETGEIVGNTETIAPEGVELDKAGLPWDVRIHGINKNTLKKTGNWKYKKGVDPALIATVEAELKAAMSAPAVTISTTEKPAAPSAPTTQPSVKYLVEGKAYTADELKGFNSGWNDENIATLQIATITVELSFPEFMAKITSATAAGNITKEHVDNACIKQGLASLPLLASRPDLIPAVNTELFG